MRQAFTVRVVWTLVGWAVIGGASGRGESAAETRLRKDVTYLASDECEGRGVQTKGINLAAEYIAHQFKLAGLAPAGPNGSYFQPFTMTGSAELGSPNVLTLKGPLGQRIQLSLDADFRPVGMSGAGKVSAPVVFAGYGATAKDIGYDDFKDLDVAGKVIVVLRKTPRAGSTAAPFDGQKNAHHAALATKMVNAGEKKALGILFVNDLSSAENGDPLMEFRYTANASAPAELPAVHVKRSVVEPMLGGRPLSEIERAIDRDLKPQSFPLSGWTAHLDVHVNRPVIPVKNVVGTVEGYGPLAREVVVVGAHYDHLGLGGPSSLARNLNKPAIHHGADDNASGTSVLLELARRLGRTPEGPRRRLVFIAFSGEESGLLGSVHYCKKPLFPLADTAAMVNLDMVGRLRPEESTPATKEPPTARTAKATKTTRVPDDVDAMFGVLSFFMGLQVPFNELMKPMRLGRVEGEKSDVPAKVAQATPSQIAAVRSGKDRLIVYGTGTSTGFDSLVDTLSKPLNFSLKKVPGGFGPSDHASFNEKKIPVLFFFTGEHADYHRPSDTAEKLNLPGMSRITDLVNQVVQQLASAKDRPAYVQIDAPASRPEGQMPRIGIRPDYGDDKDGVLLGGVTASGPAAKAGLKEGDRIVEVGGKPVKNLEAYMVLITGKKKGEAIELGILRAGKPLKIKVVPE